MTIRMNELTALEEAQAEDVAKQPITAIEDEDAPKVRIYCALAWVHKRRTDPKLSFDEYMKTAKFSDAVAYVFGSDDEPAAEEAAAEDPFPEGGAQATASDAGAPAAAEGPVLSGDGDQP